MSCFVEARQRLHIQPKDVGSDFGKNPPDERVVAWNNVFDTARESLNALKARKHVLHVDDQGKELLSQKVLIEMGGVRGEAQPAYTC